MGRQAAASAETHISWVLLSDEHAFKFPKPVVTDVVDQTTVALRRETCEREVRLNARLAPDVYLGVGSLRLGGEDLEPVIVMRRMPEDRRLSALLDSPEIDVHIRDVARTMSSFHASTEVLHEDAAARVSSAPALIRRWHDDIAGLRDVAPRALAEKINLIEQRAAAYLHGRSELLDERIAQGLIRDGHGDLLADDIFCLDDGPRILDCLAFSDDLRCGDVLADLSFLVMDLQRLGAAGAALTLLRSYCEYSSEHHPGSLAHLYVAQRALVRAKVTALRHHQEEDPDMADVGALVDLTLDHLDRAMVRIALVGGVPGSGKSTVAERMSDAFGWTVLSSDEIRRDLRLRYADLGTDDAYDAETVARVYEEMRRRADRLVRRGVSVVLDASWTSAAERDAARALAHDARADLLEIRCSAPLPVCRSRVHGRDKRSYSEATGDVVDVLARRADPWPEALVIDTDTGSAAQILDAVSSHPW